MVHEYSVALICHAVVHRWSLNGWSAQNSCQFPHYCTMLDDRSKSDIQDSTLFHVMHPLTAILSDGNYNSLETTCNDEQWDEQTYTKS